MKINVTNLILLFFIIDSVNQLAFEIVEITKLVLLLICT